MSIQISLNAIIHPKTSKICINLTPETKEKTIKNNIINLQNNKSIQSIGILIELNEKNVDEKRNENLNGNDNEKENEKENEKGYWNGNYESLIEQYYDGKKTEVYKLSDNRIKIMKGKFLYDLKTCQYVADPSGWWVSEKLDGIRAIWTGSQLFSRTGHIINAPKWFLSDLPPRIALDGELYLGRDQFHETQSIVMQKTISVADKRWMNIKYMVFDIPDSNNLTFEEVQIILNNSKCITESKYITVIQQNTIKDMDELLEIQQKLIKNGAEGTMLRKPNSKYRIGETFNLLKFKTNFNRIEKDEGDNDGVSGNNEKGICSNNGDEEMVHLMDDLAIIIGYKYNYDKMKSDGSSPTIKSILVKWYDTNKFPMNPEFHVSHHITQTQKNGDYETLFPIGQKVKILYNQLFTNSQKPRFPRYAGWVLDQ